MIEQLSVDATIHARQRPRIEPRDAGLFVHVKQVHFPPSSAAPFCGSGTDDVFQLLSIFSG
jgi:hypothetical protein